MARGIMIGVVGVLFVLAAWRADPDEAGGLDEAFAWLSQQPYGWLSSRRFASDCSGYAVFCFVNAAYRFVPKVCRPRSQALDAQAKETLRPRDVIAASIRSTSS